MAATPHQPSQNAHAGRLTGAALVAVFLVASALVTQAEFSVPSAFLPSAARIGGVPVGGLPPTAAADQLTAAVTPFLAAEIVLTHNDQRVTLTPKEIGLTYDIPTSVANATQAHPGGATLAAIHAYASNFLNGDGTPLVYQFDDAKLRSVLNTKLGPLEQPAVNAQVAFQNGDFTTTPERAGMEVNRPLLVTQLREKFATLSPDAVPLTILPTAPAVTTLNTLAAQAVARDLLAAPLTVTYGKQRWVYSPAEVQKWITFTNVPVSTIGDSRGVTAQSTYQPTALATEQSYSLVPQITKKGASYFVALSPRMVAEAGAASGVPVTHSAAELLAVPALFQMAAHDTVASPVVAVAGIHMTALRQALAARVGQALSSPGTNLKLDLVGGKIVVKTASKDGRTVAMDELINKSLAALFQSPDLPRTVAARITTSRASINEDLIDSLGIHTLLARGTSNFAGSPTNRRFNIRFGTAKYDGILIPPKATFSFNDILGVVDAASGFLPELIIRGNLIVPEYGGGLCQVSTTAFRAAFNAGLDIVERHAHSFAVSYYRLQGRAGADATIYPGSRDFRFRNDTPAYILIQTQVVGNTVTFEFYGTSDGRKVKPTLPTNYDQQSNGALKAAWEYVVYKADGSLLRRKVFYSNYRPLTDFKHVGFND